MFKYSMVLHSVLTNKVVVHEVYVSNTAPREHLAVLEWLQSNRYVVGYDPASSLFWRSAEALEEINIHLAEFGYAVSVVTID